MDQRRAIAPPAHQVRAYCDGVCVGAGTVAADDPLLNNRSGAGRQPARVVLDGSLRIPPTGQLVRTAGQIPLLIATSRAAIKDHPTQVEALRSAGAQIVELPAGESGRGDLHALLDDLGRRQWTYLLVEGGPTVLDSFLNAGLADELMVFVSPLRAGEADADGLPRLDVAEVSGRLGLCRPREASLGPDRLLHWPDLHVAGPWPLLDDE